MKTQAGALLSSLRIEREAGRKISVQLYMGLREIILSGGVMPGERLPASRTLAKEVGVSRTTVIDALDRLVAEGLLESRVGAGTFVAAALVSQHRPRMADTTGSAPSKQPRLSHATTHAAPVLAPRSWLPHTSQAFITALPALDAFPMAHWARLSARHWRGNRDDVMGYGFPSGYFGLRRAIATHLNGSRGIKCDPEQIFIVAGAQQAFSMISSVLLNPGDRVWFENPGAIGARNALVANGADLVPLNIDAEGMMVAEGLQKAPHFRLAFVTPSHQQPLGHVMSLTRRLALLQAAEDADALIVEDDYDGEFHYDNQPHPSLRSIDTYGRVIYVGTFSKSLFPSLRLGYILAPEGLVNIFSNISAAWLSGVPTATQAIVADFMDEGLFSTHVRLMRRTYKARHDALIDASSTMKDLIDVQPTSSGFHTVGYFKNAYDENTVVAQAAEKNIVLAQLSRYCLTPITRKGLVLGFGSANPDEITRGVSVLKTIAEFRR